LSVPVDSETQRAFTGYPSKKSGASAPGAARSFPKDALKTVDDMLARMNETSIREYDDDYEDAKEEVNCDCAVKVRVPEMYTLRRNLPPPFQKEAEDYDICQCDGPCGRWVHLW